MLEEKLTSQTAGVKSMIFDFDKVDYISSVGLRVLLFYVQQMEDTDGTIKAINVNDKIHQIFDLTEFLEIMNVDD